MKRNLKSEYFCPTIIPSSWLKFWPKSQFQKSHVYIEENIEPHFTSHIPPLQVCLLTLFVYEFQL